MARKTFISNRERFRVLGENRTNNVINSLRILSHCANKALYEYTQDEVEKIFRVIEEALIEARAQFKEKKRQRFKL